MNINRELVNVIAFVAGVVVSLAMEWFPGLSVWFGKLTKGQKEGVLAVVCAGVAAALYGASCAGILSKISTQILVECSEDGALTLILAFVVSVAGAQINHITVNNGVAAVQKKRAERAALSKIDKEGGL